MASRGHPESSTSAGGGAARGGSHSTSAGRSMPRHASSASSRSSGIGCRRNGSTRWWRPVPSSSPCRSTSKQQCTPSDPVDQPRLRGAAAPRRCRTASASTRPPDLFEAFNIGEDDVDYARSVLRRRADGRLRAQHLAATAAAICGPRWSTTSPRPVGRPDVDRDLRRRARAPRWLVHAVRRSTRQRRCGRTTTSADPASTIRCRASNGMGAHTDYGIVTVLWAEPVPGCRSSGPTAHGIDVIPARRAFARQPRRPAPRSGPTTAGVRRCTESCRRRPPAIGPAVRRTRGVLPRRQLGRGDRVPADVLRAASTHRDIRR